jgi:hypothetical protein
MKRLLLLIMLAFSLPFAVKATHLMGGDMVVHQDSANSVTLTISLYRDTSGVPLGTSETMQLFSYDSATGNYLLMSTWSIPRNMALSTLLLPSFPYGVEVGVYTAQIPLAPGQYRFVYNTCCRNGAIQNAANPLSESMTLYTDYTMPAAPDTNSTPEFLALPVAYFAVNSPATYNPLPYDPDADSIAWNLNTPYGNYAFTTGGGSMSFAPVGGFTTPAAASTGPFTMNPFTGEITWTPNTVGNFIQSFEVNEYRNGMQIGRIIRDMQYVVIPQMGNPPAFIMNTPYQTNTADNYNYLYYTPGQPLQFAIDGSDSDPNTALEMRGYGEVFELANNPATFNVSGSGGSITGNFSWTPPATFSKDEITVFRLRDGLYTKDFTIVFRKNPNPAAVTNVVAGVNDISIYPNPAHNELNIHLDLTKDINSSICICNMLGQQVQTVYQGKLMSGKTNLKDNINLPAGVYQVAVKNGNEVLKTVRLLIQ